MPANSQMQEVLDQLAAFGMPPIPSLSAVNARALPTPSDAVMDVIAHHASDHTASLATPVPEPVGKINHMAIPGPKDDILLRFYTPKDNGPFPVLVYFHGGGWVIADLDAYDASCRALCNSANCIVASVAYHQAPEQKYPAAANDAFAAYQWMLANAARFNGDPQRVAVGGESAGGNLATVVCLMARDKGAPLPIYQLLVYPVCNYAFDTPSYLQQADAKPLNKALMVWFWEKYLNNPAQGKEPYASPLQADVQGLPPALVITAEIDPLHDEGKAYAEKLQAAGVPTTYHNYDGVTHEFFGMKAVLDQSKKALSDAADGLKQAFSGQSMLAGNRAQTTTAQPTAGRMATTSTTTTTSGQMAGGPDVIVNGQPLTDSMTNQQPMTSGMRNTPPMQGNMTGPQSDVTVGMPVVGSGGDSIGTVKDVRQNDILVDRPRHRDVFVPKDAIRDTNGNQIVLSIPSDQVDQMNWKNP